MQGDKAKGSSASNLQGAKAQAAARLKIITGGGERIGSNSGSRFTER